MVRPPSYSDSTLNSHPHYEPPPPYSNDNPHTSIHSAQDGHNSLKSSRSSPTLYRRRTSQTHFSKHTYVHPDPHLNPDLSISYYPPRNHSHLSRIPSTQTSPLDSDSDSSSPISLITPIITPLCSPSPLTPRRILFNLTAEEWTSQYYHSNTASPPPSPSSSLLFLSATSTPIQSVTPPILPSDCPLKKSAAAAAPRRAGFLSIKHGRRESRSNSEGKVREPMPRLDLPISRARARLRRAVNIVRVVVRRGEKKEGGGNEGEREEETRPNVRVGEVRG